MCFECVAHFINQRRVLVILVMILRIWLGLTESWLMLRLVRVGIPVPSQVLVGCPYCNQWEQLGLSSNGRGILRNVECGKLSRLNLRKIYADFFLCKVRNESMRNVTEMKHLVNICGKLETYKSNITDNMQRKHILLASKAKHLLTSQVKICQKSNHVVRR